MSRWSVRVRAAAAVAAVAVLATGCAQRISGLGTLQARTPAADVKLDVVNGTGRGVDVIAANAISDIEKFWTEQMPKVFGEKYEPVKKYYSIDPDGTTAAPCTDSAREIRGNAFYCPSQDIVAWDRKLLFPKLEQDFDPFLITMVLAHEWGHAIQKRSKLPSNRTIVVETQADCYAGAFTRYSMQEKAPHQVIDLQTRDKALSGYLLFRDPVGADQDDRQAHGSGFDRISGFQDGYEKGAKFCTTFSDERVFTQKAFQAGSTDEQNKGNLPFSQTITAGPRDVDAFWTSSFSEKFGGEWKALGGGAKPFTPSSRPQCNGGPVPAASYCGAQDTVYFDTEAMQKAYTEADGDFGPISLIAVAYGYAVRQRLNLSIDPDSELVYQGAICLAGGYAKDSFALTPSAGSNRLQLSPGDLDEAIRTLLDLAGTPDFTRATGTNGFERVQSFREGFDDVKSCR